MNQLNPYECPHDDRPRSWPRIHWHFWFYAALGAWMFLTALRQHATTVREPYSFLAGVLVVVIGCAVGRIIGTQRGARQIVVVACFALFVGLCFGWVNHPGEERTMWAFACLCTGLVLGAAYPPAPLPGEGMVESLIDEEEIRFGEERRN